MEVKIPTKERIILEALNLFSVKGYDGASIRDIAGAVGIKESSVYKHYKSKQDIFDSILVYMTKQYESMMGTLNFNTGIAENYIGISEDILFEMSKVIFLYFLKDDLASKFRKMLTIAQFSNRGVGMTFIALFVDGPLEFQSNVFQSLIQIKGFKDYDPKMIALHFYSPIFLMLCKYDNAPDRTEDALYELRKHINHFREIYVR